MKTTVLFAMALVFVMSAYADLVPEFSSPAGEVQMGYSENGPWNSVPGGFFKKHRTSPPAGKGVGKVTATWIMKLSKAPGRYRVQATWVANATNAKKTPFSIFDDTKFLQTVYVNQQVPPRGTKIEGTTFQDLGYFVFNSPTAKVILSNEADGTVVADTVRVTP